MEFVVPSATTFLPKGRVMTKTLPFRRPITAEEFQMIGVGSLHVYAYAVLTYGATAKLATEQRYRVRTCSKYNPITMFFQHTPFFNSTE
jgi:hypothetical protein